MAMNRTPSGVVKLTPEQAEQAIVPGARAHTFVRSIAWAGADMDREQIIAAIESEGGAEICDDAAVFEHRIAVQIRGVRTFIETDPARIQLLLKQAARTLAAASAGDCNANLPTSAQLNALRGFAQRHGRTWKSKLNAAWASGRDERLPDAPLLRQVRNEFGPVWLARFSLARLPAQNG